MFDFKRLGKALVCLCMVCLIFVSPVSALSTFSVAGNTVVPENPTVTLENPAAVSSGHLVSYVRYSASAGSTIIGCLEDGTKLEVLGTKGKFYKIDCYDMNGYIAKSQVAVNEAGEYYVKAVSGSSETTTLPSFSAQETLELRSQLVEISKQYIGVRYVYGGTTPRGFDCSGYTQYLYKKVGITLNRSARQQLSNGIIVAREDMQPGDLVVFSNTGGNGFASHIGMYLGNGLLIHSGASRGICIVELDSTYFDTHFQCARRVVLTDVSVAATMPTVDSITGGIGSGWRNEG